MCLALSYDAKSPPQEGIFVEIRFPNIMSEQLIVWFRNDLRLHDHEALAKALKRSPQVLPVYVFDPRWFKKTPLGFHKTNARRAQFLIESVADLRANLRQLGSDLVVRVGKPEEVVAALAEQTKAKAVYTSEEVTYEEVSVDGRLENRLKAQGSELKFCWMSTLYHYDDLPFDIEQLPDVFTEFRKKTERFAKVRAAFARPKALAAIPNEVEVGQLPTLAQLGFEESPSTDPRGVLPFKGGETEALRRLDEYFWQRDQLRNYKETRNEMLGADFSSKFSVWLSNGCLSPRFIYEEVKRYEHERIANDSTYWLIFELIWRDYFRFVALKYQNAIFFPEGIKNDQRSSWQQHERIFWQWANGQTGIPLIDANMIELQTTGFMSNRGRQNVASFLAKDLHINWTWGAAWFESQLLDYDVCSNWGNWNYVAGVGNDPRENRYFNIYTQATRYDAHGNYVKHWIPALKPLPADRVHLVSMLKPDEQSRYGVRIGVDYPKPLVNAAKWLKG